MYMYTGHAYCIMGVETGVLVWNYMAICETHRVMILDGSDVVKCGARSGSDVWEEEEECCEYANSGGSGFAHDVEFPS